MSSAEEDCLGLKTVLLYDGIGVGFCRLALGSQVGGDRYNTLRFGNAVRLKGISLIQPSSMINYSPRFVL
jgi:hypothetical protein